MTQQGDRRARTGDDAAMTPGLGPVRRLHLVGAGGSGLVRLARILLSRGLEVSGSDMADSSEIEDLRRQGMRCAIGQAAANVPDGTDLVVISAAVGEDNPEVSHARRREIPVLKYAQCLGRLMAERTGIAVAGTHGKTTTTAMVASVLVDAGRDPGFVIGGDYRRLGGGSAWGTGPLFVAEACEFDRSFLNLRPAAAIVTNIEEDHLDYFGSLAEIRLAFAEFAGRLPPGGLLVLNADDPHSRHLPAACAAPAAWFSLRPPGSADTVPLPPGAIRFWADRIRPDGGGIRFHAMGSAGEDIEIALQVPGAHNVKNALATLTLLAGLGVSLEEARSGLEKFTGVCRRFEILRRDPVVVIDDYAHHPTEIEAVLRAARETFGGRRLRLVFQPHQHSRMRRFLPQFARVLVQADEVVVAEVYRARDPLEEVRQVSASLLAAEIERLGGRPIWAPTAADILDHLRATLRAGEVLICLGAGDITQLARRVAGELGPALCPLDLPVEKEGGPLDLPVEKEGGTFLMERLSSGPSL